MPSTTNKLYSVQVEGSNTDSWGAGASHSLNEGVFEIIDKNFGGLLSKALTSIPVTLSASEAQNGLHRYTGALSANIVVTYPALGSFFVVENATTNAYTVTLSNGVGSTLAIPQGGNALVFTDATNGVRGIGVTSSTAAAILTGTTLAAIRTALGLGTIATFDEATAAQYRANTAGKALSTDKVWSAAGLVTLTDGGTITPDFSTGFNFTVTLAGNRALANPTNTKDGQSGVILIKQDATGTRTLSYGGAWKWAGGSAPVLTASVNGVDKLFYFVESSSLVHGSLEKDSR